MRNPTHVRFYGKRPIILLAISLFLLTGVVGLSSRRAHNAKRQDPAPAQATLPKDVQDLMMEFDDIGEAKAMAPLKLTPDQIDQIVIVVGDGQAEYNRKNADLTTATIRGVADTIRQAKKEALEGKPAQGEEQVVKAMNVMLPKRSSLEIPIMNAMCDKVFAIISQKQQETMAKVTKDFMGKNAPANASVSQLCKLYIYRVFAGYNRSVVILNELKALAEGPQQ